ncbi:hypothetical protein K431DRAFT_321694 [Polychaeton citri CBS 116435]|uniref:Uncharacterized protein n=1 Tax=Polychaeton citri CBS 116435 TaxID=1314669 RepID=A0A9P4Q7Q5_9PEZI|nr:hypothetical protein K431DRAFT_321694 [Polychaeton citri CBS 116435]
MTHGRHYSSTSTRDTGIMSRLRPRRQEAKVTESRSTNPITGTRTSTRKVKTHPHGLDHHGHGGRGPMASNHHSHRIHTTTTGGTGGATTSRHRQRRPSTGDKISGALLRFKGSLTGRPGQKAAGTRRAHGTDGRGTHHRTARY